MVGGMVGALVGAMVGGPWWGALGAGPGRSASAGSREQGIKMALANSAAAKREGVSGQWESLVSGGTGVGTLVLVWTLVGTGAGTLVGRGVGTLVVGTGVGGLGGWVGALVVGACWGGEVGGEQGLKKGGRSQWSVRVIAMRCGIYQRQRTWVLDVKTHL